MTLRTSDRRRRFVRGLAFASVAAAGYVFGITSDRVAAQPPQPPMTGLPGTQTLPPVGQPVTPVQPQPIKPGQPLPEPDRRVVGYIYGNVPITREQLGDFLIARGGHEKLALLANKMIIEVEAARRGVTVTTVEIKAGLEEDLRGLGISLGDFEKHVLPKYNKTLYEWVEDVIKPRLLLTKMCQDRVKVTDEDIQKVFLNRHGERRQAQLLTWSANDLKVAQRQWDEARKGDAEFNSIARQSADPNIAAADGRVKPVGKYPENANDTTVVEELFKLKVGEMSGILKVPAGLMCVKCIAVIPPDANVKLDDKMKEEFRKELYAKKLEQEIPKFFTELKLAAKPNLILTGPPSAAEFRAGVGQIVNQAGGVPTVPPPLPTPAPMKP